MSDHRTIRLFFAGITAFLATVLLGLALGVPGAAFTAAPAAAPKAVGTQRTPGREETPQTVSFTNAEFLDQVEAQLGQEPLYRGSFSERGVFVDWAVFDGMQNGKLNAPVKVAAYSTAENGAAEALRLLGYRQEVAQGVTEDQALLAALQMWGPIKLQEMEEIRDRAQRREYASRYSVDEFPEKETGIPGWELVVENHTITLFIKEGTLQPTTLDDCPWKDNYPFAMDEALKEQVKQLNREYRHGELAAQLNAFAAAHPQPEDPFLCEMQALVERAALLEDLCEIDRTSPSRPILQAAKVTGITDTIHFAPRLTSSGVSVEAGFLGTAELPFQKVVLLTEDLKMTFSGRPGKVARQEDGTFLNANDHLFDDEETQRMLDKAEKVTVRFLGPGETLMREIPWSQQEKTAFDTLYELFCLQERIYQRLYYYQLLLEA